jgi:hypothetical protein
MLPDLWYHLRKKGMKKKLISLEGNVKENKGITNVRKVRGKIRKNRKIKIGDQEQD